MTRSKWQEEIRNRQEKFRRDTLTFWQVCHTYSIAKLEQVSRYKQSQFLHHLRTTGMLGHCIIAMIIND